MPTDRGAGKAREPYDPLDPKHRCLREELMDHELAEVIAMLKFIYGHSIVFDAFMRVDESKMVSGMQLGVEE